ncbi:DUF3995 domain-containing protein [soil metagenome]
MSALWLGGSTWLLDTVGGDIEKWGRERPPSAVVALGVLVVVKAVVAVSSLCFAHIGPVRARHSWPYRFALTRSGRALGWLAASVLVLYGSVLTAAGLAVQGGLIDTGPDADQHALRWHTYLWDPWFAAWGLAMLLCMYGTRPDSHGRSK